MPQNPGFQAFYPLPQRPPVTRRYQKNNNLVFSVTPSFPCAA